MIKIVIDIIAEYLTKNNYDGLCGDECGCEIKDLFSCESSNVMSCAPGYKIPCDCEEKCFWHMTTQKPNNPPADLKNFQAGSPAETF